MLDGHTNVQAAADLSTFRYRALAIGGTLATTPADARGIQTTRAESGHEATIKYMGPSKFVAGGAVAAGARLAVGSGGFMVTAGSGDISCGYTKYAASSGEICPEGIFNFVNGTLIA